ncbi:radical SAM protein [Thiorhodovibrio frisius]|uniref:Putative Fe-S oxidoreductase n=1 Tax=Thiorhodovibrio frisius TaxID=631362 RepID=H8YWK1_9GAMM|nr:radical SAM protein [Thiorhodovibrio frisius]EIC22827.1 putative Fe-S oxidoreductase [Thiorhodovibrio frisius]WPL22916.1 hypothetical protein Thiofri_03094 [Thiorhodovibrio frisius]
MTAPTERSGLQVNRRSTSRAKPRLRRPSLRFVEAINFELTYDCPLACRHCLQADLRRAGHTGWAKPAPIIAAIQDAVALGLIKTGVNFTGGEILRPGSPLPPLLEATQSLGVPVRVNTNGWWGLARHLEIGEHRFRDATAVLDWLADSGVSLLAFSWDRRFDQYPELKRSLLHIIGLCEQRHQPYQVIITGETPEEQAALERDLLEQTLKPLHLAEPVVMDLIDIGAARCADGQAQDMPIAERLAQTPCAGRGFYRPSLLHVAPNGQVRSCLYAPGAGWLGSLQHESLETIVRQFADNRVVRAFAEGRPERLLEPHGSEARETVNRHQHPCALAAGLAWLADRTCD